MSEYPKWAKARHEFATEVAKYLTYLTGEQWIIESLPAIKDVWNFTSIYQAIPTAVPENRRNPGVPTIHLNGDNWKGWNEDARVKVSGWYPRYNNGSAIPYGKTAPSITCAVKRGPLAVAKDIARRFLPDYLVLYQQCQKRCESTRKYDEGKRAALEQVAQAFGVETRHQYGQSNQPKLFRVGSTDVLWGDVEEYKPGAVKIGFRDCPVALAEDIGRLVREYLDGVGYA